VVVHNTCDVPGIYVYVLCVVRACLKHLSQTRVLDLSVLFIQIASKTPCGVSSSPPHSVNKHYGNIMFVWLSDVTYPSRAYLGCHWDSFVDQVRNLLDQCLQDQFGDQSTRQTIGGRYFHRASKLHYDQYFQIMRCLCLPKAPKASVK